MSRTANRWEPRPRLLHPLAWWGWALGLAALTTRTTNPLLLLTVVGVAALVVSARRTEGPWGRSFSAFLRLGAFVLLFRIGYEVVFGPPQPGTVVVTLPEIALPFWLAGVRLGGEVTSTALVSAVYAGLQLVAMLACVGAANALVEPSRLLKTIPAALYEVGVAVVVALSLAPQSLAHAGRVREARRLRGRPDHGLRTGAQIAGPVLEGALERSLRLAAAMDARGFGRTRHVPTGERRLTAALVIGGLAGVLVGGYALLDAGTPGWQGGAGLLVGAALAAVGLSRSGRRSVRTVYRPAAWRLPESVTLALGILPFALTTALPLLGFAPTALRPDPSTFPAVPAAIWLSVLLAAAPAFLTPEPPTADRATPRSAATTPVAAPPRPVVDEVAA